MSISGLGRGFRGDDEGEHGEVGGRVSDNRGHNDGAEGSHCIE